MNYSLWRTMANKEKVSKQSVNYRTATGSRRCGNCGMYYRVSPRTGNCDLVVGVIEERDVCDEWISDRKKSA